MKNLFSIWTLGLTHLCVVVGWIWSLDHSLLTPVLGRQKALLEKDKHIGFLTPVGKTIDMIEK